MEIKVMSGDITRVQADAAIVNIFEGKEQPAAFLAADQSLQGLVSQLVAAGEIKGKLGEVTVIHTLGKIAPARVAILGLGEKSKFNAEKARRAIAEACRTLRKAGAQQITTVAHGAGLGGMAPQVASQAVAEGSILGLYTFSKHQTKEPEFKEIKELILVEKDKSKIPSLEQGVTTGRIVAEATNLARDMSNEPANFLTPTILAERARQVAHQHGLEVSVLEREQMEALGMGAVLSVARGSDQPPKFIVLSYKGDAAAKNAVGFIGKAITFDSGGISLKPSEGMAEMKSDMSGAAAVIAAMSAIAQLKLKVNVTGLMAATENLPSGHATKPGDVVAAMSGKTIEVVNTDAEGRLTLADVLCYARKLGLSPLIDLATLTGACHVALGDFCSGAFTNNQELQDKVVKAGEEAGECMWPMPMYEEYKELNKSDVADIKNVGNRYGGAITAAQFLAEFAQDTPWVHLDIAGTAFTEKGRHYLVKGGTGVGVRTLVNLARAFSAATT